MSSVYRFIFSAVVLLICIFGSLMYFNTYRVKQIAVRNPPIRQSEPQYVDKIDLANATTIMNGFKGNFKRLHMHGTLNSVEVLSSNILLVEATIPEIRNVAGHVKDSQVSALLTAFGEFLEKYLETARSMKSTWEEWGQIEDQRNEIRQKAHKEPRNAPYGDWQDAQLLEKEQELNGGGRFGDQRQELESLEQTFRKLSMRLDRLTMVAAEMKEPEG